MWMRSTCLKIIYKGGKCRGNRKIFLLFFKEDLRILTGKKHRQRKLQRLQKVIYGHLGCWYITLTHYKRILH